MSDIYDQHKAAFSNVAAYVVMRDGERVATIAIKFPKDGAGRLYAYVHWLGVPMVRGQASGFGYDKRSAAVAAATKKIAKADQRDGWNEEHQDTFIEALSQDDGRDWERRLEAAGFNVFQAV